jgi:hypothetical protein
MIEHCCEDMREALTFDGPIAKSDIGWIMAEHHLTESKKAISKRAGSRRIVFIRYCPFCGQRLGEADSV